MQITANGDGLFDWKKTPKLAADTQVRPAAGIGDIDDLIDDLAQGLETV